MEQQNIPTVSLQRCKTPNTLNECPTYDIKPIWWWGSNNAEALGNAGYLFIAIDPRSTWGLSMGQIELSDI